MLWTWISSPMPRSRPSAKLASWSLRRKCNVLKVGGRDNTCIYTPCYEYRFRMIPNNSSPYSWIPCHQKKIGIWNGTISINIWIWCPPKPASLLDMATDHNDGASQRWPFQWCFGMFLQGFSTNNNRYYWVNLHCYWGVQLLSIFGVHPIDICSSFISMKRLVFIPIFLLLKSPSIAIWRLINHYSALINPH